MKKLVLLIALLASSNVFAVCETERSYRDKMYEALQTAAFQARAAGYRVATSWGPGGPRNAFGHSGGSDHGLRAMQVYLQMYQRRLEACEAWWATKAAKELKIAKDAATREEAIRTNKLEYKKFMKTEKYIFHGPGGKITEHSERVKNAFLKYKFNVAKMRQGFVDAGYDLDNSDVKKEYIAEKKKLREIHDEDVERIHEEDFPGTHKKEKK